MEFEGKRLEDALEKASAELNTKKEKLKYEVITYGSTGIFGLVGVKKARIRILNKGNDLKMPSDESDIALEDSSIEEIKSFVKTTLEGDKPPAAESETVEYGKKVIEKIAAAITTEARVDVKIQKEKILFSITGGKSGVLIGKRGQTLEAIQYLAEKMINKKSRKRVRILIDVEGYQEKRKENLKRLSIKLAQKAKRTKKPVTLGMMNAHDRRIVHIRLKEEDGVRTQSIGEGYYRKLMIFPKKNGKRRSRNRK